MMELLNYKLFGYKFGGLFRAPLMLFNLNDQISYDQ